MIAYTFILNPIVIIPAVGSKSWHTDSFEAKYKARAFVQYLSKGKQGAIHLRPKGIGLEFKINIPHGTVVYMSREILGYDSGNSEFPFFQHKHLKQGASISCVFEVLR